MATIREGSVWIVTGLAYSQYSVSICIFPSSVFHFEIIVARLSPNGPVLEEGPSNFSAISRAGGL